MASRVDVARIAGVSPAVVSYVTNGSHPVAATTRARVLAAIDELGYRPNAIARSLAINRSHTMGLLLPDSSNPYFAELSSAIEDAAFDVGYTVLLGNGGGEAQRELTYVRTFLDRQVDGVIVCPDDDSSHSYDELVNSRIPVVITDRLNHVVGLPAVAVDHAEGARMATEHLIWHRRGVFACISGSSGTSPAQARVAGWAQALGDAGIPADHDRVAFVDFTARAGWEAMRTLLERKPDIDAVFVASDIQAVGALRALADSGRRVGADVSVVGFDGIRLGEYISPRLTTVAQPFVALASAIVRRLLAHIEHPGRTDSDPCILSAELKIRESCGCSAPGLPPVSTPTPERHAQHPHPQHQGAK